MGLVLVVSSLCFLLLFMFLGFMGPASAENEPAKDPLKFILGQETMGPWKNSISEFALAPGPVSDVTQNTLVLAANRTNRPDIFRRFKHYHDGWDITNRHYWASVGFTGTPGFILAFLWFISFGIFILVHHCCWWRFKVKDEGSCRSQRISLILLIVFTCAALAGCVLLSVGQDEFHREVLHALNYVVNQSDYTVQILRNVTEYLSLAKSINVAQVFLPSDVMNDIDKLNVDLNTVAETLSEKTGENSVKIKKVFKAVRSALITIAAVMLFLAVIGLFLSILGHQHAIHIFIISGWLLVVITFILCGVFVILNNTVSDTCMAMQEWVENPHAETALSNILPCVDQRTTNLTLVQSKRTINGIVNVVNIFIYTYANAYPSQSDLYFYNQSGPLMLPLCYPFNSQLRENHCGDQEVSIANASMVWQNYICDVSESGKCITPGRVTPNIYGQLVAAVNESYALEHYTPPLLSFQDCNFVRDTFQNITSTYCPPLGHYLKIVSAGLALISVGVLLCLVLWILYANHLQRGKVFVNIFSLIKGKSFKTKFGRNRCNEVQVPSLSTPAEV